MQKDNSTSMDEVQQISSEAVDTHINYEKKLSSIPPDFLLGACVKADAFSYLDEGKDYFSINFDRVKEVIDSVDESDFEQVANKSGSEISSKESLQIPVDFKWEEKSRKTAIKVIKMIRDLDIVPLAVIVQASKYAGPGNIIIHEKLEDGITALFSYGHVIDSLPDERRKDYFYEGKIPIPDSKKQRDQTISLDISKKSIVQEAESILALFNETGLEITTEQALELALARSVVHEYGHAIDVGLNSLDIATFKNSRRNVSYENATWRDIVRHDRLVHKEHFARGIEELIFYHLLMDKFNFTPERANEISEKLKDYKEYDEETDAFFTDTQQEKGLHPQDIMNAMREIYEHFLSKEAFSQYLIDQPLHKELAYLTSPYAPDDIKLLVKPQSEQ